MSYSINLKFKILLDELGFTSFIDELRNQYLNPLAQAVYGDEYMGSTGLDSHKAFIVTYKIGHDIDLGYHYDNAEITLNVSLGRSINEIFIFKLCQLNFFLKEINSKVATYILVLWLKVIVLYFQILHVRELKGPIRIELVIVKIFLFVLVVEHVPTFGVLHRGQHLHGAEPIKFGERYNLIIWMRSSSKRSQFCPMCRQKPECLIPVEFDSYGDGMIKAIESN